MEPVTQPTHLRPQTRAIDPAAVSPGLAARARRLAAALLPIALLLTISLPALTYRLGVYPPIWFDEGYRTNAGAHASPRPACLAPRPATASCRTILGSRPARPTSSRWR